MFQEFKELPIKLSDEDKERLRTRNADIDIEMIESKEKLDYAKGVFKSETEEVKKEKKKNLQLLRQGYEMKKLKVTEYIDMEEATIEYSDEDGVVVHTRSLTIDERRELQIPFNKRRKEKNV